MGRNQGKHSADAWSKADHVSRRERREMRGRGFDIWPTVGMVAIALLAAAAVAVVVLNAIDPTAFV